MLVLVWWGVASQLEGSEETDENLIKGGLSNGGGRGDTTGWHFLISRKKSREDSIFLQNSPN